MQSKNDMIDRLKSFFPKGYANYNGEFVAHRLANRRYGGASFSLQSCHTSKDVTCAVIEYLSYECCQAEPFELKETNEAYQEYMAQCVNGYLGTDFTELEFKYIYLRLGNRVNRQLTLDFVDSGYNLEILKASKMEKMVSAERLLKTINGLEYRARTLEQTRGGNHVLRKLVPKLIESAEQIRILPATHCYQCEDWERNAESCFDHGFCKRYGCSKHERGFCDEGRKETQNAETMAGK